MRLPRFIMAVASVSLLGVSVPPALAQIPDGIDPTELQSMIPSAISVPAGQTTTVDVGVPVEVGYSGGGWEVTSAGTSVTVTAPDQPGAQISVAANAAGFGSTFTLTAEEVAAPAPAGEPDPSLAPTEADVAAPSTSQVGQAGQNHDEGIEGKDTRSEEERGNASTPDRKPARPVSTAEAEAIHFNGTIEKNLLTVKVPLNRVNELMPLADVDRDGLKLRYLDINGQIIEDVQREINVGERQLTFVYPEGQIPDNPFIVEAVRDDEVAEYIVTIIATNAEVAVPEGLDQGEKNPYSEVTENAQKQPRDDGTGWTRKIAIGLGGLFLLCAVVVAVRKLRR